MSHCIPRVKFSFRQSIMVSNMSASSLLLSTVAILEGGTCRSSWAYTDRSFVCFSDVHADVNSYAVGLEIINPLFELISLADRNHMFHTKRQDDIASYINHWLNFGLPPRVPKVVWGHWGEIGPFSATLAQDRLAEHDQPGKNIS